MSDAFLNGPEYDLQDYEGRPLTTYLICSTGRSGSTLLCDLMRRTTVMGVPHEYANLSNHGQPLIQRLNKTGGNSISMEGYFDAIVRARTSANGVFGMKAHPNQFLPLLKSGFIRHYFSGLKYIHIQRRDLLAQAVSWNKASQTGKWTSLEQEKAEPAFSFDGIEQAMAVIAGQNALWQHFFILNGIEPLQIVYEDLLEQPLAQISRIAEFLGVPAPDKVELGEAGIQKQSSQLNDDWKQQFNALLQKL